MTRDDWEKDCDRCPRCGGTHIRNDYPRFGCRDCGYAWDIDEEETMRDANEY